MPSLSEILSSVNPPDPMNGLSESQQGYYAGDHPATMADAVKANDANKQMAAQKDAALAKNADPLEATQSGVIPSLPGYTPPAILGNNGNTPSTLGWQKPESPPDAITGAAPAAPVIEPSISESAIPIPQAAASERPTVSELKKTISALQPPAPNNAEASPQEKTKNILPMLMNLLQTGLLAGSAYYQRRGGDMGTPAYQAQLERQQQQSLQKNQIQNQLKMQAIEYQQQRDMAGLDNHYRMLLLQPMTDQQKQLIMQQYEADRQKLMLANKLTWDNFQKVIGGQSVGSALGAGAPDLGQSMQLLNAAKVGS